MRTARLEPPRTSATSGRWEWTSPSARPRSGLPLLRGSSLTKAEKEHLALGAEIIVLENALRFLTDHLEGDVYFRIHRPGHNLDRSRTQLAFFHALEERGHALRRRIEVLAQEAGA